MKDFNINKDQKTSETAIMSQKKEHKLIQSQRVVKGHRMFELDLETMGIKQLAPPKVDAEVKDNSNVLLRKKYVKKDNCIYTQALNLKNAKKKFSKWVTNELKNQ